MWTRKELKQRARAAIRRNYWLCVVAALLLAIFVNQAGDASHHEEERSGYTTASEYAGETVDDISGLIEQLPGYEAVGKLAGSKRSVFGIIPSLRSAALAFQFSLVLLLLLLNVFVASAFEVGIRRFFVKNAEERAGFSSIFSGFTGGNYFHIVVTLLIRNLKLLLWTLLLIIPGIIKSYEYMMVPYLMGEHPEMSRRELFRQSREMMDGNKFDAFVLDLSFIGWILLSALSGGLVAVFWMNPYQAATAAELYRALRLQQKREEAPEVWAQNSAEM
ncbi:MAG: DUF975 family protein [Stomatobaculum sp.]